MCVVFEEPFGSIMGSSNKHWPSMFKSKPCNSSSTLNHHQYLNPSLISYSPSGPGCEGRAPEPKPRWNPRPEQIRILESIFNSGLVNPPRDEIRKIRAQLQEYGPVGDANVFYWFQNRKSRSKHKQRHLQTSASAGKHHQTPPTTTTTTTAADPYSPPYSSGKSSSLSPNSPAGVTDCLNSPTASVNQRAFAPGPTEFHLEEPFFYQIQQDSPAVGGLGQGLCFSGDGCGGGVSGGAADQGVGGCQSFLLSELMLMSGCSHEKFEEQLGYGGHAVPDTGHHFLPPSFYSSNNQIVQGVVGESVGPTKSTVFVNDVFFEVGAGPFNVREAFGDDAVLIESSGQPVLTDEWGITLYPLQHGAFYYLLRTSMHSSPHDLITTIDLI